MKLGRYEIVREIGKGAMGVVYLATDPVIGRQVALKTIRLRDLDDEDAREHQQRFIREAQAAGILSHPSIVTVHDIGEMPDTGTSFIAMQYVDGPNLKELIQRNEVPDWPTVCEVIAQVADALQYAHARGIVHRDVKPANIMLTDGVAKITDFGIAKIASVASNLTTTGQFIGTPNYMAPEQVKGTPVDGRSDLFSLGIILYELLTRRKPFAGDTLTTISYKIVHEDFPPLREVAPAVPQAFEGVLAKALAKSPEDRYQSGTELAADLRKLRQSLLTPWEAGASGSDETLLTQTPGTATRPPGSRTARRLPPVFIRRIPAWLFFSVVALALIGTIVPALFLWRGQVSVPQVDEKREATMADVRALRVEGRQLLADGNVSGAYQRFKQIQRIRPASTANNRMLAQLEATLSEKELEQRRIEEAQQVFSEGVAAFRDRKWDDAIRLFEQSFALDPTQETVVNYLRMAREQLNLRDIRSQQPVANSRSASGSGAADAPGTSSLQTVATSTVADGYLLVRVGGRTIVHENFWMERPGLIRRRTTRDLSINASVPAGSQEVEVWVVVPSRSINTRRTLQHNFRPNEQYRLTVAADPNRDTYDINIGS